MMQYLDGGLYVAPEDEKDQAIPSEYECVICCGVVLDPKECSECQTLYCSAHLGKDTSLPCPKRCGSSSYRRPHRLVLLQLSKMKFRCQKYPKCQTISTYEGIEAHLKGCAEYQREARRCAKCQPKIDELEAEL